MPVPVVTEPINRVPTRETVAGTLRDWIIDGTLAPEEVLRDADIANAFGISRTPVREALLQLEHEGLVESQPGRWTRVTPLDPTQLTSIYPVWVELESLAARIAATHMDSIANLATAEDAAQLFATAISAALSAPGDTQARAVREADACFHDALLTAAGNPTLRSTLTPLRLTIRRFEYSCPNAFATDNATIEDHLRILTAIRSGNPDAAAAATRAHLRHVYQCLCTGWGLPATD